MDFQKFYFSIENFLVFFQNVGKYIFKECYFRILEGGGGVGVYYWIFSRIYEFLVYKCQIFFRIVC